MFFISRDHESLIDKDFLYKSTSRESNKSRIFGMPSPQFSVLENILDLATGLFVLMKEIIMFSICSISLFVGVMTEPT